MCSWTKKAQPTKIVATEKACFIFESYLPKRRVFIFVFVVQGRVFVFLAVLEIFHVSKTMWFMLQIDWPLGYKNKTAFKYDLKYTNEN